MYKHSRGVIYTHARAHTHTRTHAHTHMHTHMHMLPCRTVEEYQRLGPPLTTVVDVPADTGSGGGILRRLNQIVERNVKIGRWNVGSMTGRRRDLVEMLKRRNIGILCVQETK